MWYVMCHAQSKVEMYCLPVVELMSLFAAALATWSNFDTGFVFAFFSTGFRRSVFSISMIPRLALSITATYS